MKLIRNENVDPFDVDGTLVIHKPIADIPEEEQIEIYHPATNRNVVCQLNRPMIRLLYESIHRGSHVIVWSRGGWAWAEAVLSALHTMFEIDLSQVTVMSKPRAYFDDSDAANWMSDRIFIGPNESYKEPKQEKINKVLEFKGELTNIHKQILEVIKKENSPTTEAQIKKLVKTRNLPRIYALRDLVEYGYLKQIGRGVKSEPYHYIVNEI